MKKKTIITTRTHEVWVIRRGQEKSDLDRCEELLAAEIVGQSCEAGVEAESESGAESDESNK